MPVDIESIPGESHPMSEDPSAPGAGAPEDNGLTEVGEGPEAPDEADDVETAADGGGDAADIRAEPSRRFSWVRVLAYGVLPVLVLVVALGVGYLKWLEASARLSQEAAAKSVQVATESTIAMLSYRPETAEKDLTAAGNRLTGVFRDDYIKLIKEVVVPDAKQKWISSVATVPAAASVSATKNHAVVLVCVDQTTVIGNDPPSNFTSSARITLEKVHDRWLISQFTPV